MQVLRIIDIGIPLIKVKVKKFCCHILILMVVINAVVLSIFKRKHSYEYTCIVHVY